MSLPRSLPITHDEIQQGEREFSSRLRLQAHLLFIDNREVGSTVSMAPYTQSDHVMKRRPGHTTDPELSNTQSHAIRVNRMKGV